MILALCLVVLALLLRSRLDAPEALVRQLAALQAELQRVSLAQVALRDGLHGMREAAVRDLSQATQGIRGELGLAQRALAAVKALEEGRAREAQRAAESLRRLEAVVAGSSSRGAFGENILARAFAQLPPDLVETNVAFGSRVVEYALRLPVGGLVPIDSKWTVASVLEELASAEDPAERRRLCDQVLRDLRLRIREVARYLDPERTPLLALLALPDAVYWASAEAHADGYRQGVIVVPYSLALPFVLALYRLSLRFGTVDDHEALAGRLRGLVEALRCADEEIEGRLSRGLVLAGNARDAVRSHLAEARGAADRVLAAAEREPERC